ncbi:MAG: BadF/BadG/BcrA/BcrD ATPase family protein [Planctomycetota bacterium]
MAEEKLVLGMDVGGTKTHAILANTKGELLGQGFATAANINFVTLEQAEGAFTKAIGDAVKQGGIREIAVEVAVIGIEPSPEPLHPVLSRLVRPKRIIHKKEGECSLVGGLAEHVGLSLIAGTGSVGWGRNKHGQTHMTSCWGTIGDEGSAYDLARRGVNAAFRAADGRGRPTALVDKLLEKFGVEDMRDVCTPIYQSEDMRKNFASLSRMVMETAMQGDEAAIEVVKEGASQIAIFLTVCAEQLGMETEPYRIAATGGLVSKGGWYFDLIQQEIHKRHPKAALVQPKFEPCVGAVLLALKELDVEWDKGVIGNMERTVKLIEG